MSAKTRAGEVSVQRFRGAYGNKNGFQAAIPETLRSAARVKINGRNKVHAKFLKIQPLQGLDTIGGPVEQKNSCFRDWRTQLIKIAMFRRSEKLALAGGLRLKCLPQIVKAVTLVML